MSRWQISSADPTTRWFDGGPMRSNSNYTFGRVVRLLLIMAITAGLVTLTSTRISESAASRSVLGGLPVPALDPTISTSTSPNVAAEGWVRDASGLPVQSASIDVAGRHTVSDAAGYFSIASAELKGLPLISSGAYALLDVNVDAAGFAGWKISGVRYYPGDTVRLYPYLAHAGSPEKRFSAAISVAQSARSSPGSLHARVQDKDRLVVTEASALQASPSLPAQIRV